MPIGGNDFSNKHFLDSAVCVSDILADLGYKQAFLAGTNFSFAGKRNFFQSHNIKVMDLPYFQSQNLVPKVLPQNMRGAWDLKDAELFKLAKNHLDSLSEPQPFALYLLNVDTHFHDNFVDKEHCASFEQSYLGTIKCTDKLISDFVDFVRNSKFGKNTTIIILGDHLSMRQGFFPHNAKRFVYNAFINPRFTQKPTPKLTKNRTLSHFDITPLILDSLGIRTKSFGLGRNPLYGATLLESEFDINGFNALLVQRNKIYDSFWEMKNAR